MLLIIADDSSVMRKIVGRTLRQAGLGNVEIVEAADGVQLVELVREHQPDLVLSDWNMPNLTGIEALRQLRGEGDQTLFGFVTSEGSQAMRDQATEAGAAFLVSKPFTADSIADALAAFV